MREMRGGVRVFAGVVGRGWRSVSVRMRMRRFAMTMRRRMMKTRKKCVLCIDVVAW